MLYFYVYNAQKKVSPKIVYHLPSNHL